MRLDGGRVVGQWFDDPDHPVPVNIIGLERRRDARSGDTLYAIFVDADGYIHVDEAERVEFTGLAPTERS